MHYELEHPIAARAERSERAAFIRRTYLHLAGAILAFVGIEFILFTVIPQETLTRMVMTMMGSPWSWLLVVGLFVGAGYLARRWAMNGGNSAMAYAGLGLYVVAEAIIFIPLLYLAVVMLRQPHLIAQAGILTLCIVAGLTAAAFTTRKDFSFLGPIIWVASLVAFGLVIVAVLFGFNLGLWFAFFMVALASAAVLYDTSNVIHQFRTDQEVAAALSLFASIATLFYYILWILLQTQSRD